jgi:hypothetical protein
MADSKPTTIAIPLNLPRNEASALAQFVKRVDYETCARFASRSATYGGCSEADTIWRAVNSFQRQLAEAGFAPR